MKPQQNFSPEALMGGWCMSRDRVGFGVEFALSPLVEKAPGPLLNYSREIVGLMLAKHRLSWHTNSCAAETARGREGPKRLT